MLCANAVSVVCLTLVTATFASLGLETRQWVPVLTNYLRIRAKRRQNETKITKNRPSKHQRDKRRGSATEAKLEVQAERFALRVFRENRWRAIPIFPALLSPKQHCLWVWLHGNRISIRKSTFMFGEPFANNWEGLSEESEVRGAVDRLASRHLGYNKQI